MSKSHGALCPLFRGGTTENIKFRKAHRGPGNARKGGTGEKGPNFVGWCVWEWETLKKGKSCFTKKGLPGRIIGGGRKKKLEWQEKKKTFDGGATPFHTQRRALCAQRKKTIRPKKNDAEGENLPKLKDVSTSKKKKKRRKNPVVFGAQKNREEKEGESPRKEDGKEELPRCRRIGGTKPPAELPWGELF